MDGAVQFSHVSSLLIEVESGELRAGLVLSVGYRVLWRF